VGSVLITQCVQNDFLRPLAEGEPLPNLVHVGRLAAERLCGPAGALVGFLEEAHAAPPEELAIVHLVDRHDAVAHAVHLARFRPHCLAGSEGARLIAPIDALASSRERTLEVAGGDLNDLEDSRLAAALDALAPIGEGELRIGVVGVWTDAKVAFLLYDLRTRWRVTQLATCSALTASRSAAGHFRGLDAARDLLGVEVFHSPSAFLDWLVPGRPQPGRRLREDRPRLQVPGKAAGLSADDVEERDALLLDLLGDRPAELRPLGGGFSGAQVFVAHVPNEPPTILKVGRREEIAGERHGNERIGRVLGDVVPGLLAYREGTRLAAMRLELARADEPDVGEPTTFKGFAEREASEEADALLEAVLEEALDRGLGRLYRVAEKDNADLLEAYGFVDAQGRPQFGASVSARARDIAEAHGFASARALLEDGMPDGAWLEPATFYGEWLPGRSLTREVYPTVVHADLNLANILFARRAGGDRPARTWVIDFARLSRLPSLTDFAKVENDLAYVLFPLPDETALRRARNMQEARLGSAGLHVTLTPLAETAGERRHARLVERLRRIAARCDPRGEAAMADYRVALLRYAAHSLGFDEPNPFQKRLALEACARLAGALAAGS
jgi:hypothetical protein